MSASCVPKLYGWEHIALDYPRAVLALQTIPTTHGIENYQHLRFYALIALISNDIVNLQILVDGNTFIYPIASTGGVYAKPIVPLQVMKGKTFSYRLSSNSRFMCFQLDCEFGVKGWGDTGPYRIVNPFGAGSVVS